MSFNIMCKTWWTFSKHRRIPTSISCSQRDAPPCSNYQSFRPGLEKYVWKWWISTIFIYGRWRSRAPRLRETRWFNELWNQDSSFKRAVPYTEYFDDSCLVLHGLRDSFRRPIFRRMRTREGFRVINPASVGLLSLRMTSGDFLKKGAEALSPKIRNNENPSRTSFCRIRRLIHVHLSTVGISHRAIFSLAIFDVLWRILRSLELPIFGAKSLAQSLWPTLWMFFHQCRTGDGCFGNESCCSNYSKL